MQEATRQGEQTNAIAQGVQSGETDILALWLACRRYVTRQARRWHRAFAGRCGVELEDLEQTGFLALARAAETWRVESGAFSTWLTVHLRAAFSAAYGMQTERSRREPLNFAVSLEMPPAGTDEDCMLCDIIPDTEAERAFEAVEQQELCEAVQSAIAKLPEEQQAAIYGEFWQSKTADPAIRRAAFRALRSPAISRPLRNYF